MNFAQETYNNLMKLIEKNEAFCFRDFTLEDKTYRVMDYNLASWTMFQEPSAINCRGTMFDITDPNKVSIVSLPPAKFFNYEEGGVPHHHGKIGDKMVKMDGSLISSYIHNGDLYLKSKGALFSKQALAAMHFLNKEENAAVKKEVHQLTADGYTVNFEYTAPDNRIVVPYQTEDLTLLSAREIDGGKNFFATSLLKLLAEKKMHNLEAIIVAHESLHDQNIDQKKFVDDIRAEEQGEGYVVEIVLPDGSSYLTKLKNIKYCILHQAKDGIEAPRNMFEAVLAGTTDDLRGLFSDDAYVLQKIQDMEDHVQPIFNHMVKTVEKFCEENKHLDKKTFAMKAIAEEPVFKGLIINQFVGKENDYVDFARKHRKDMFGIADGVDPTVKDENSKNRLKVA